MIPEANSEWIVRVARVPHLFPPRVGAQFLGASCGRRADMSQSQTAQDSQPLAPIPGLSPESNTVRESGVYMFFLSFHKLLMSLMLTGHLQLLQTLTDEPVPNQ